MSRISWKSDPKNGIDYNIDEIDDIDIWIFFSSFKLKFILSYIGLTFKWDHHIIACFYGMQNLKFIPKSLLIDLEQLKRDSFTRKNSVGT